MNIAAHNGLAEKSPLQHDIDATLNAFTATMATRTFSPQQTSDLLSGYTFAVKNLYDVRGMTTLAGSETNIDRPPATHDAVAVRRLIEAGAQLRGTTNMDEFAYGFTTENHHFGATRNPHDLERSAGGSSGGSAAAVAAGLVDFSLGSDTNGSIRVPASFCGIFGFKPTFGSCDMQGVFPFIPSLDHIGPFAPNATLLALTSRVIADNMGDARLPDENRVDGGWRVGILSGYFETHRSGDVEDATEQLYAAFPNAKRVELPNAERMRSAAFLITASEGGCRHATALREDYERIAPGTRERLAAGLIVPAEALANAYQVRRDFLNTADSTLDEFDIVLAPSAPCTAPRLGQEWMTLDGQEVPTRASLGLLTQPLTPLGTPIVAAPLPVKNGLPVGVQIMGKRDQDALVLEFTRHLENLGHVKSAPMPKL